MSNEFDLWYYGDGDGGYPRKEGRGDARKAFTVARKTVSLKELIEGRKRYAEQVKHTERQFIKLPGGWIRDERYADEFKSPVVEKTVWERREESMLLTYVKTGRWSGAENRQPTIEEARAKLHEAGWANMEPKLRVVG